MYEIEKEKVLFYTKADIINFNENLLVYREENEI